jgi:hypothetical protein
MKEFIGEYGRIVILSILGIILLGWVNSFFLEQVKEHFTVLQSPEKTRNELNSRYSIPVLHGLEKDGKPLSIKIDADTPFHPLEMENLLHVSAEDVFDGDLTDKIKVYIVTEKNGKERKQILNTSLDTSGKNKLIILSYEVTNSAGFQAEKRISVLISKIGGGI